ncbi:MAG: MurR/RpiR family transcriptional regulator [Gammaproteobacteria bacterium]
MATRMRDVLTEKSLVLTPSEAKIAQVLLADYPLAGLGTATSLAKRAGVSDPTVIRLVTKLGFVGYPAFQARLLEEVDAGLRSPIMMMEAKRPAAKGRSVGAAYLHSVAAAIESGAATTLPQTFDRAVTLIMEAKGRVVLIGGRFSRHVSGMLAGYLAQFRDNVSHLSPLSAESFDSLVDLGPRDVLVAFDYRRYQTDVIRFTEQAVARGVPVVLFTDPWRSPIAANAKVVLTTPTEVSSPYDSLAPAVAQIEALLAHIVVEPSNARDERGELLEEIRTRNVITVETTERKTSRRNGGSRPGR